MVLIVINKKVYFDQKQYDNLKKELDTNIKKLLDNNLLYDKFHKSIIKPLDEHKQVNRKKLHIYLTRCRFQNVYEAFRLYKDVLNVDEKRDGLITVYNKGHKHFCKKNFDNTNNVIIDTTNFIIPSTFNNKSLFNDTNENNYRLQNSYKKTNKLPVLVIASSVPILVVSAILFGTFIYIKYKKNNSNTNNVGNVRDVENIEYERKL